MNKISSRLRKSAALIRQMVSSRPFAGRWPEAPAKNSAVRRVVLTACDHGFFGSLETLVSGIHRHAFKSLRSRATLIPHSAYQ